MKGNPKVRNWSEYNKALKKRGAIIFSFTEEGLEGFYHHGERNPGGVRKYSALMYEVVLKTSVESRGRYG